MSRRAPSGQAWQEGEVYTLHFWPPYGDPEVQQAKHYTGWAEKGRLARRLTDHILGRGARLTQVQREAGGTWVVADVQPGTRDREQQLKERGATRRCHVCQAIEGYQAGKLTQPEALVHAGWARANPREQELLLEMLGIEQAPENMPEPLPERPIRRAPDVQVVEATAELEALVDALEARWHQEAQAEPEVSAEQQAAAEPDLTMPEPEAELAAERLHERDDTHQARPAREVGPSVDTYRARHAQEAELSAQPPAARPEYLAWRAEPEVSAEHQAAAQADLADVARMPARSSPAGRHARVQTQPTPEPQAQAEIAPEAGASAGALFRAAEAQPELELELELKPDV